MNTSQPRTSAQVSYVQQGRPTTMAVQGCSTVFPDALPNCKQINTVSTCMWLQ